MNERLEKMLDFLDLPKRNRLELIAIEGADIARCPHVKRPMVSPVDETGELEITAIPLEPINVGNRRLGRIGQCKECGKVYYNLGLGRRVK